MTSGVVATLHNPAADRCVKIVKGDDGAFGFKEFRRDPEDSGGWTVVADNSQALYASKDQALAAAQGAVPWLRDMASPAKE